MTAHVKNSSGNNEWHTPVYIVDAARSVMGEINIDPASSAVANKIVQANCFYTIEDSGLEHHWYRNVWMNPPYQRGLVDKFVNHLVQDYKEDRILQACVLVNNATETAWWQELASISSSICFLKGRVKFLDEQGSKAKSPLQGQTVCYVGDNADRFDKVFGNLGTCLNVRMNNNNNNTR